MNDKFFNNKYSSLYLPVHSFALFIVASVTCGESQPVYGGVYMVGGHNEEYFYPIWMAI
jgi:hypothetical protein